MRVTGLSATITIFLVGGLNWASAAAELAEGCKHFDNRSVTSADAEISELLKLLPESSAAIVCEWPEEADSIYVMTPIRSRDGVSYCEAALFDMPEGGSEEAESLLSYLDTQNPVVQNTMMTLGADSDMSHLHKDFVETHFISLGTFKNLYNFWSSAIQ